MGSILRLNDITAGYGDLVVLDRLSMDVRRGERLLIAGPNGAGKSTVFKVISGLLKPSRGSISFNGKDITKWNTKKRVDSGIGYLLQTKNTIAGLTVRENLELSGAFLGREEFEKRLQEVLSAIPNLGGMLKRRAGLLSGGERQILAISMVFIRGPRLVLLDEPTAGVAPGISREIISYLVRLQDILGIETVCMVEHNLREVLNWATMLVLMSGGKIEYCTDDPGSLLKDPGLLERYFFGNRSQGASSGNDLR